MPVSLPTRSPRAQRLSLPETIRFFVLLARSRWLLRRLNAAHERVSRLGDDAVGDALLLAARSWLACHEEIEPLLGLPPPPPVAQVRAVLRRPAIEEVC
jgi:hypothetical protein